MNILVLIPTLGYGGAERLLITLLPKIKEKGHKIKVCTLSGPLDLSDELIKTGIEVKNLNLKHRWSIVEAIYKVYKEAKQMEAHIIWGHLYFGILYGRLASIFLSNVKVISVLHYHISHDTNKNSLWEKIRNFIFNKTKFLDYETIAVSKSIEQDYKKFFGWKNIRIIYNAVDFTLMNNENTNDFHKSEINPKEELTIVLPGRLHESKGHKYLIEAIKILEDKINNKIKVYFIGDGNYKDVLLKKIKEEKLNSKIIFTGNLKQVELFEYIKKSDIVVIPSLFEAFGLAAIEAMYLKKPLIVSKVGGLEEITTNNYDALQVPPKHSKAISEAILKLYNNPSFAKKISENANKTASKYDVNLILKKWLNIFEGKR